MLSIRSSDGRTAIWRAVAISSGLFGMFLMAAVVPAEQPPRSDAKAGPSERFPEIVPQFGHSSPVRWVEFSPDGRLLATSSDYDVILWDMQTGQRLRSFASADSSAGAMFSPDGKMIVTSFADQLIIWDPNTGRRLRSLSVLFVNGFVVFSPDSKQLIGADYNGVATIWDLGRGGPGHILDDKARMASPVAFSPDGSKIAVGGSKVVIYDTRSRRKLRAFEMDEKESYVYSLRFSPGGSELTTLLCDDVTVWNAATGEKLSVYPLPRDTRQQTAGGLRIAQRSARPEKALSVLWDPRFGPKLLALEGTKAAVMQAAFSPDGKLVATGIQARRQCRRLGRRDRPEIAWVEGHPEIIKSLAFSHDSELLAAGCDDGSAVVWDARTGRTCRTLASHVAAVRSLAIDKQARRFAVMSGFTAAIWDADGARQFRTIVPEPGQTLDPIEARGEMNSLSVAVLAFGRERDEVLTGGSHGAVVLRNIRTDRKIRTFSGIKRPIVSVAFGPKANQVTACSSHTGACWNIDSGTIQKILRDKQIAPSYYAALSSDGHVLGRNMPVWDVRAGKENGRSSAGGVPAAAISANGKLRTTVADATSVVISDANTGKTLRTVEGPAISDCQTGHKLRTLAEIRSLTFSPDGRLVLGGFIDGTAVLWSASSGKRLLTFVCLDDGKEWLTFTPDGRFDGSAGGRKLVAFRVAGSQQLVPGEQLAKTVFPSQPAASSAGGKRSKAVVGEQPRAVAHRDRGELGLGRYSEEIRFRRTKDRGDHDVAVCLVPLASQRSSAARFSRQARSFRGGERRLCGATHGRCLAGTLPTLAARDNTRQMGPFNRGFLEFHAVRE